MAKTAVLIPEVRHIKAKGIRLGGILRCWWASREMKPSQEVLGSQSGHVGREKNVVPISKLRRMDQLTARLEERMTDV